MNEITALGRFFPLGATTTTNSIFLHSNNNNNDDKLFQPQKHGFDNKERSFVLGESFLERCSQEESLLFSNEAYRLCATRQRLLDIDNEDEQGVRDEVDPKDAEDDDDVDDDESAGGRDETMEYVLSGEEELWWRKNTLVWSSGRKICKTFTLPSSIVTSIFCDLYVLNQRHDNSSNNNNNSSNKGSRKIEKHMCALYSEGLYLYSLENGTTHNVVLPCKMCSIWPSPFGLLLERSSLLSPFSPLSPGSSNTTSISSSSSLQSAPVTPPLFSLHHPLEEIKPVFSLLKRSSRRTDEGTIDVEAEAKEDQEQTIEDGLSVLCSDECIPLVALYDGRNSRTIVSCIKWVHRTKSSDDNRMQLPDGILPELTLNHVFITRQQQDNHSNIENDNENNISRGDTSWGSERASRTIVTYGCHDSSDPVFAFVLPSSHSLQAVSFSIYVR